MRAAIYLRVSTDHVEQKLSPEHQLMTCKEYAEDIGLETDEGLVYNDAGFSGTEMEHRPEVQRLVADARNNKFDAVVFTAISRFARDLSDALNLRKRLETVYGIRIISVEEGYDTSVEGRNSEMVFTVHAMMAAHKSQEMSKAIRRGLRQSAAKGRHIGNITPYGYRKDSDKKLTIQPEEAHIIRHIFDSYLTGAGSKTIAEELNSMNVPTATTARGKGKTLWQASTINAILRNPVYAGKLVANKWRIDTDIELSRQFDKKIKRQMMRDSEDWIVIDGDHVGIIDEQTFEAVQQLMTIKATNKGVKRTSNVLSGLMRCAECGRAMIVSGRNGRNGTSYKYVVCSTTRRVGKSACKNHVSFKYDTVLEGVLDPLRAYSATPEDMEVLINLILQSYSDRGLEQRIVEVRKQLEHNSQRQREALRGYTEGMFSLEMVKEHQQELQAEEKRLREKLNNLEGQQASQKEVVGKREEIRQTLHVIHHIDDYDPITVRTAFATIIDYISFSSNKRMKVSYKWDASEFRRLNASLT